MPDELESKPRRSCERRASKGCVLVLLAMLLAVGGCPARPVDDPDAPDYSEVCDEICDALFECQVDTSYSTPAECRANCGDTATKLWGECGPQTEAAFGCSAALSCDQAGLGEPPAACASEYDVWESCMGLMTDDSEEMMTRLRARALRVRERRAG